MPTIVVAALSARALAQSARRAGWRVIALDLFGDVDTRDAAAQWIAVGDAQAMRIEGDRVLAALRDARAAGDCLGWVAGAGFEAQPDLLDEGACVLPLIGNDAATLKAVRDPRTFFAALDALHIAHPATRWAPPEAPDGWLAKDFASSGGWHVRALHALPHAASEGTNAQYYQRDTAGAPMSLLFVADGKRALPIGINALFVRPHGTLPYVYHGAVGPVTDLPAAIHATVGDAAQALVERFSLRGLASLDFLFDGTTLHVLEINPRPTATLPLYDTDAALGLLRWHVDACRGVLPLVPARRRHARCHGESIVFAPNTVSVDDGLVMRLRTLGCHDVPFPHGAAPRIPEGAPLCTVAAEGENPAHVNAHLRTRENAVLALVQNRNEVASHVE